LLRGLSRRLGSGGADVGDDLADRDCLTGVDHDVQDALRIGLQLEAGLIGLHLGEDVALLHRVAGLLLPRDDGALLHGVGELRHVDLWHYSRPFPTISSARLTMSSAEGMASFSSCWLYGIGTSAPPIR